MTGHVTHAGRGRRSQSYEIRVRGLLGQIFHAAFPGLRMTRRGHQTVGI
jgi:hypothetical protein